MDYNKFYLENIIMEISSSSVTTTLNGINGSSSMPVAGAEHPQSNLGDILKVCTTCNLLNQCIRDYVLN